MLKNRVAEVRIKKGWTQEKLAGSVGISRVALSAIENGTTPNGDTMINIAKALDSVVEDLFVVENVI